MNKSFAEKSEYGIISFVFGIKILIYNQIYLILD